MTIGQVTASPTTKSNALARGAAAALLIAAGIVAGVALTGGPANEIACGADSPDDATCFAIPASINDTCASDDTIALYDYFYQLPAGTSTDPTDIEFPSSGCYLIQGQEWLRDFTDFIFNGNGAEIQRTYSMAGETWMDSGCTNDSPGLATVGDLCLPHVDPVCGESGNYLNPTGAEPAGPAGHLNQTNDLMFFFEGGCDIVFNGFKIVGPDTSGVSGSYGNPPGGGAPVSPGCNSTNTNEPDAPTEYCQPDSFITFAGTNRAIVFNCNMNGPDGDFVDEDGLHEAVGTGGAAPGKNVTVIDNTVRNAGREAFSQIQGIGYTIEDNTIYGAAATILDLEDDTPPTECTNDSCGNEENVDFSENDILTGNYTYLVAAHTSARVTNFEFSGNRLTGGAFFRIWIDDLAGENCGTGTAIGCGQNIDIGANTSTTALSSFSGPSYAPILIQNAFDNYVHNNVTPVNYPTVPTFVSAPASSKPTYVEFNTLSTGVNPFGGGGSYECGNVDQTNAALDSACATPNPPTIPAPPSLSALPHDYDPTLYS